MARRTVTTLIDDLDGSEIPEGTDSTMFSLNGKNYRIDLTGDNQAKLQKALDPFIDKATRISSGLGRRASTPSSSPSSSGGASRGDLQQIREWAKGNGYSVSDRGRIKGDVIAAYDAAH